MPMLKNCSNEGSKWPLIFKFPIKITQKILVLNKLTQSNWLTLTNHIYPCKHLNLVNEQNWECSHLSFSVRLEVPLRFNRQKTSRSQIWHIFHISMAYQSIMKPYSIKFPVELGIPLLNDHKCINNCNMSQKNGWTCSSR